MIDAGRFNLRDFEENDRAAFVAYQNDSRYRALYDLQQSGDEADTLFEQFVGWQQRLPRLNWQLAIVDKATGVLLGSAGLRREGSLTGEAVIGIELAPSQWGRYRLALDAAEAIIQWGFTDLSLNRIVAETSSGNHRAERILSHIGARKVGECKGPEWMQKRGWREAIWEILP